MMISAQSSEHNGWGIGHETEAWKMRAMNNCAGLLLLFYTLSVLLKVSKFSIIALPELYFLCYKLAGG